MRGGLDVLGKRAECSREPEVCDEVLLAPINDAKHGCRCLHQPLPGFESARAVLEPPERHSVAHLVHVVSSVCKAVPECFDDTRE